VKTLQDRPALLSVEATTIAHLTGLPAPARLPDTRLRFERHVFKVKTQVTLVRHEKDSDLHLALQDGANPRESQPVSAAGRRDAYSPCAANAAQQPLKRHPERSALDVAAPPGGSF
jgi:hypothetical protein